MLLSEIPDPEPQVAVNRRRVPMSEPIWLTIARELQAIAQTGLTFTQDRFDKLRYERLRELAAQLVADGASVRPTRCSI